MAHIGLVERNYLNVQVRLKPDYLVKDTRYNIAIFIHFRKRVAWALMYSLVFTSVVHMKQNQGFLQRCLATCICIYDYF